MHTDEGKRFDKRNIENNLRRRIMTKKDYEIFLAKLPDVSDKIFNPEEKASEDGEDLEAKRGIDALSKKKGAKAKAKEKG
jgi:hypothetical protein